MVQIKRTVVTITFTNSVTCIKKPSKIAKLKSIREISKVSLKGPYCYKTIPKKYKAKEVPVVTQKWDP